MSDEMNVKISEIKAKFIRKEAELVDKYCGNNDGKLDKSEGAKLAQVLSGELDSKKAQKKLAKESDEVKAMFGLSVSEKAETTQAEVVAQQSVVEKANNAIGETAKKIYATPFEEVKARFLEVMEYNEKTNTSNGTTAKEAYKAVKKEFKGKEYKEAISQLKDYAKHDFVNMRAQKTRAAVQAYDGEGRLVNEENLQYDTSKKVYKREKELTKANNNGVKDSWAKKAIRNKNTSLIKRGVRYISGNDSAGKTDDKAVAAGNRAVNIRENRTFSKADLVKALGEKNPLVQEYTDKNGKKYDNILVATGLITVAPNGEYIVKNLSNVVGGAIGADNTLNDHNNHNESEIQSVLTRLYQSFRANGSGEFKTSELRDKDVRKLVEFLGYRDDRAQLLAVRMWQHIWKGVGSGAAAGAAAGAVNGSWTIDVRQHQEVNMPLEGFTEESKAAFLDALKSENSLCDIPVSVNNGSCWTETTIGNITETAIGIYIAQDQMINGTVVSLLKAISMGALAGAGVGAAIGIIEGLCSKAQEKEVLGMIFDCDSTYEEIIDTIDNAYSDKNLSPQMKEALKEIARLGIVTEVDPKTGARKAVLDEECNTKWDYCQFIEKYNDARGNQILNRAEVAAAARTADKHQIEVPECNPEATAPKPEPPKETSTPEILWAEEMTEDDNMNVKGHSWDSLATLYDCLPADKNKAKRMLKVMQGMNGAKLTVEQISELADISMKEVKLHYKRQNGKVVTDKFGNPIFDIEDAIKQLQNAFANFKFPEGYSFNYVQCAHALCARVPGDNKNEIIAPDVLLYDDGRTCNKQKVNKPTASHGKAEVGDRGNAGKVGTSRNAVKDDGNPVQHNVSGRVLSEAKKKGKQDQTILNR